jgi:hypothetical protein
MVLVSIIVVSVVGPIVAGAPCCLSWKKMKLDMRRALSSIMEKASRRPEISSDVVRDAFSSTVFVAPKPVKGHTHPDAAAIRTAATLHARKIAAAAGGRLYSREMSKSDQRHGIAGNRQWFWAKDVNADNRNEKIGKTDILWYCDVDYYEDMPWLLSNNDHPVLIYTVVPEDACSTTDNTTFMFNEQGELVTFVSGGGKYQHRLWDYGMDSTMATRRVWFGMFPTKCVAYAVERLQVAYSRQLILLSPIRLFNPVGAFLAKYLLEGRDLTRFDPVVKGSYGFLSAKQPDVFIRFRVPRPLGCYITTGIANTHVCCTIEADTDSAVQVTSKLGAADIVIPTTASWLGTDNRRAAAVLTAYCRQVANGTKIPTVYPVSEAVRTYDYNVQEYHSSDRAKLVAFMSPLVHGAFTPVFNKRSEERCIEGRVNKLKKPEPKPNAFVDRCMIEFAELVVGDVLLHPVDVEHVASKQTRPQQKLSLKKAAVAGPFQKRILKCFLKAEAYPGIKDPRNISTYNDSDKLLMSQFALALSQHCKKFEWYAPGKTPLEIAHRVADICRESRFVNVSDYHRMDGTITAVLRRVDKLVFIKAFGDHRDVVNELLKRNSGNVGFLPEGTTFEQGTSHGSGCPATSVSQTLRAAFAAYLGYRHTRSPTGDYYTPDGAFAKLGIHLGDDGLDPDLPTDAHEWAATRVGLVLEAATIDRGEPGVTFLARYYTPNVWYGDPNSMCDVRRQLSKFHTTVRLPANVSAQEKLLEKSSGFVATDGNTPVIGQFCKRVVDFAGWTRYTDHGIQPWWSKFDQSVQFPNENHDGWMDAEFERLFPEFERNVFNRWLSGTANLTALLAAPLCVEIEPATPISLPVVVDGDVLPPLLDDNVETKEMEEQVPPSTVDAVHEETKEGEAWKTAGRPQRRKKRTRKEPSGRRVVKNPQKHP